MQMSRRQLLVLIVSALTGCGTERIVESSTLNTASPITAGADAESTTIPELLPSSTPAQSTLTPTAVQRLVVIERAGWGAAQPAPGMIKHEISHLTVHHTAVELTDNRLAPARLRAHQQFHQTDRGWPDLAYHYAVDQLGNIYEGRSLQFRGDTATNYDPTGHFLVVLEGNFDEQPLPDQQHSSLVDLLAWAAIKYAVDPSKIHGHRDYAETSCPGNAVYSLIAAGDLAEAAQVRIGEGPISLVYLRGEAALQRVADIEA
jgi:hypothetical protein